VAYWRELIERRRHSGLSVARYCAEVGVSSASFYLWQRKLRDSAAPVHEAQANRRPASRLVPVHIVPDATVGHGSSAIRGAADLLEVELPGKIYLRIPSGYDAATLQVVLSMLLNGGSREGGSC
jgi:hypothetical protein